MTPAEIHNGSSPIVLGFPHTGTFVPEDIFENLTPLGQTLGDTDWHIHNLYEGLLADVTTVRATFHRYVIDANRDPSGSSLYPGENTTDLVPLTDFDGEPLWQTLPSADEIELRKHFHSTYHSALRQELDRIKNLHGFAILFDCHSIRSKIPFLFDGVLPDFNIGTNNGATCAAEIETAVAEICAHSDGYISVTNGRFKGGWTTRHYGKPTQNIHAIQMELAQSTYLHNESLPYTYDPEKAHNLRVALKNILTYLAEFSPFIRG